MKKILFALLVMFSVHKSYAGFFCGYDKKTPEENVADLAIEQIERPNDPYINYNLGVALYQTGKYTAAKDNFERAVCNAKNRKLKERSYFNLANSFYKNALSCLPAEWESENTKIEQDKLAAAIESVKQAVKNYESLLVLNNENEPAKTNLKTAKELLEKLMKKQQQQKQDQKKDNKQDDKKDQKEQEDKQESKDQQKQNSQQDKSQDKQQDKSGEQKQESGQKQQQDQANEQKDGSEQSKKQEEQVKSSEQKESIEQKSMRSILESLQHDEDYSQKQMIKKETQDQKPLLPGQKSW